MNNNTSLYRKWPILIENIAKPLQRTPNQLKSSSLICKKSTEKIKRAEKRNRESRLDLDSLCYDSSETANCYPRQYLSILKRSSRKCFQIKI